MSSIVFHVCNIFNNLGTYLTYQRWFPLNSTQNLASDVIQEKDLEHLNSGPGGELFQYASSSHSLIEGGYSIFWLSFFGRIELHFPPTSIGIILFEDKLLFYIFKKNPSTLSDHNFLGLGRYRQLLYLFLWGL